MGTYIVTGATGGIGRALVEGLVADGASHVILACRNTAKADALISQIQASGRNYATRLEAREIDLLDLKSVERFAAGIIADRIAVQALFNNAGIMPGKVALSADGYESATQTNLLSTVHLTELLLPAINDGGTVIFTTSITRHIARFRADWATIATTRHNRFVTYGRSKKMLTAYALLLSRRLADRRIRVNCSDPGIVDSNIITMGHVVIDNLSNRLFRPLIYTTIQGAAPALAALYSPETARIFTLKSVKPIPESYAAPLPTTLIAALLDNLNATAPQTRKP